MKYGTFQKLWRFILEKHLVNFFKCSIQLFYFKEYENY